MTQVREVLVYPHPALKQVAREGHAPGEIARVSEDLVDTMDAFGHCVGLAATQLGELVRIVVVDVTGHRKATTTNGRLVLVNPRIVREEGAEVGREGCLSIPELTANVRRATTIEVEHDGGDAPLRGLRGALPPARDRPPRRPAVPRPRRLAHCGCVPAQATRVGDSRARDGHRRMGRGGRAARGRDRAAAVGPDVVLIRVRAAGVNPVDTKIRGGYMAEKLPSDFPLILGWDAAGVVDQVGPGGHRVQARRRGLRLLPPPPPAVRHLRRVHLRPRRLPRPQARQSLSLEEAAALPLSA